MPLLRGTRVGPYDIIELLGEGGMGTVYRARDPRLQRDIAVKAIRAELTADRERLARFQREARLLASLTHPNIATIFGLEEVDGIPFLVMELVPGVTLAERLAEGPIPVNESLSIASQIAAGMEAAHEQAVIHRDLKPANIKLTPAGTVKVLDFGLAKALTASSSASALAHSPTLTAGTGEAVILGTAAYMSPEQTRNKDVDRRTDVWAFGCVLYDMFTGKPAFAGDTLSDTIAAILTRDPDWSQLPDAVPPSIRQLLKRCLEKDSKRRLRDIGDARLEIDEALARSSGGSALTSIPSEVAVPAAAPPLPGRAPIIGPYLGGAFAAGLLAGAALLWLLLPKAAVAVRPVVQFSVPLGGERLAGIDFPAVAFSPAETHIAYIGSRGDRQQLFIRSLSGVTSEPIAGTDGALGPFFSPDGQWVGFFAEGKLKKVPVKGGPVRDVADAPIGFGASWGPDNTIVYAPNNGSALWLVSADGGQAHAITKVDIARGEFSHRWPQIVNAGRSVLFTVGTQGSWDDADIVLQAIKTGERHTIVQGGTVPHYIRNQLFYVRAGAVLAASFDPASPRVVADASRVLEGVAESADGAAQLSISPTGSAVFVPASGGPGARTMVWVDGAGRIQPLPAPPRAYSQPRLSPDGRTIALTISSGDRDDVWTYDIARNALTQLTFDGGSDPVWSRDGLRLLFSASRGGPMALFWKRADGNGAEERVTHASRPQVGGSTAADGTVALVETDSAHGRDISLVHSGDTASRAFLATQANEGAPAFSPDGRWIAFVSDESGRNEVHAASVSDPARRVAVSTTGGTEPVWRQDGAEIFYRSGTKLMAAGIRAGPSLSAEKPRALFEGSFEAGASGRPGYDVSADGTRFLMMAARNDDQSLQQLRVVLSWTDSLKRERQ